MIFSLWMRHVILHYQPIDFRKGIDGLIYICNQNLSLETRDGTAFIFTNRSRKSIKVLLYDGQGFWLCQKRFSEGRLRHWPNSQSDSQLLELSTHELLVVLFDGDLSKVSFKEQFCKVG